MNGGNPERQDAEHGDASSKAHQHAHESNPNAENGAKD